MRYGMNLLLWTGELSDELIPVLHMLKNLGYDGVELPIFNLGLDYAKWGKKLDEIGLARRHPMGSGRHARRIGAAL